MTCFFYVLTLSYSTFVRTVSSSSWRLLSDLLQLDWMCSVLEMTWSRDLSSNSIEIHLFPCFSHFTSSWFTLSLEKATFPGACEKDNISNKLFLRGYTSEFISNLCSHLSNSFTRNAVIDSKRNWQWGETFLKHFFIVLYLWSNFLRSESFLISNHGSFYNLLLIPEVLKLYNY